MPHQPSKRASIIVTITDATALIGMQSAIGLIVATAERIEVSQ